MVPITRLYADDDGHARFEDIEMPLVPAGPSNQALDGPGIRYQCPDHIIGLLPPTLEARFTDRQRKSLSCRKSALSIYPEPGIARQLKGRSPALCTAAGGSDCGGLET